MRVFYFIGGILIGIMLTVKHADYTIASVDKEWSQIVSALSLSAYNEGILKGKEMDRAKTVNLLMGCYADLTYQRKRHCMPIVDKDWKYKRGAQ